MTGFVRKEGLRFVFFRLTMTFKMAARGHFSERIRGIVVGRDPLELKDLGVVEVAKVFTLVGNDRVRDSVDSICFCLDRD